MQFKIPPYKHQLEVIDAAKRLKDLALFWEMGTGKTGGMINILRQEFNDRRRMCSTLIVTPIVTISNWANEFKIHSSIEPRLIFPMLCSPATRMPKLKRFLSDGTQLNSKGIVILNYDALRNDELYKVVFEWGPELIIFDESHTVKNPTAKISKLAARLADRARRRFIMTGSPILNSIADVFWQYRVLDGGETFGTNKSVYMSKYMVDKNANWKGRAGYFPAYVANENTYPELTQKLYSKAFRVLKKDCLDLPPMVKKIVHVSLTAQQKKHYDSMKRDFITFVDSTKRDAMVAQIAATKALRLMQICSGYLATDDGREVPLENNPKLEKLTELLQDLTPTHKVIIWTCFNFDYLQIAKLCSKLGILAVGLTGQHSAEEKTAAVNSFQNDPNVRVVIGNRRAGGIGINLTAASYSIVFSRNFSLADELQSEARNHRGGSEIHDQIVKIDLCVKDTIEEAVIQALWNKEDVSKQVIDIVKQQKKKEET